MNLERMTMQFLVTLKMSECNSIETTNTCSNLSDQSKIRLNEIKNQRLF